MESKMLFGLVKRCQKAYGAFQNKIKFELLRTAFGANFVQWFDIIRRVLFVVKKLACPKVPNSYQDQKSLSKCFKLLSEFRWSQHDWNVNEFLQTLKQFDPKLSQLFLRIITEVMHHQRFSELIQESRIQGSQECVHTCTKLYKPYNCVTKYVTLRVIDSLVEVASADPALVG